MCKLTRKERNTIVKENTVRVGKTQRLIYGSEKNGESRMDKTRKVVLTTFRNLEKFPNFLFGEMVGL